MCVYICFVQNQLKNCGGGAKEGGGAGREERGDVNRQAAGTKGKGGRERGGRVAHLL